MNSSRMIGKLLGLSTMVAALSAQTPATPDLKIDWSKTVVESKSTPTLQVVVNPMLLRGSPMHDGTFSALKLLGADYVRYVPWLPYPKQAVAELERPTKEKTSWDFRYIDPALEDFMNATAGHSVVMNFSTRSLRRPRTESYGPHMPTSVMKALPPGRIFASAVGTCVCVPKMIDARPSSQWPIATFSLLASAWKSQTQQRTESGICESTRSAAAKGSSAGRFM